MAWRKCGQVYRPDGSAPWAKTHAYVPTPFRLDERTVRIYCAFWNEEKTGRLGFVDVDAAEPQRVLRVAKQPILADSRPGSFDDAGVTPSCVFLRGGKPHLFYIGWQKGVQVRYFLFSGIAVSADGGATFRRLAETPVLDRRTGQIYVRSAPYVLEAAGRWHLWYIGGNEWLESGGKQIPTYDLFHLESRDGLDWSGEPTLVLAADKKRDECGLGRPWVVHEEGKYKMWFSIRYLGKGYGCGYAESADGLRWERCEGPQILEPSRSGWDSEMVCFNAVIDVNGRRWMFYNGNNFGETGFGVAQWT
jgi:hypothetical protein